MAANHILPPCFPYILRQEEVGNIEKCVEHASRVRTRGRDNSPDRPPRGWGAGMDMADWLEAQCYARRSECAGVRVYVYLRGY